MLRNLRSLQFSTYFFLFSVGLCHQISLRHKLLLQPFQMLLKVLLHFLQPSNKYSVLIIGPLLHTWDRRPVSDHCILRSLIGWKGQDHPSSLHTTRWRPKGPKKLSHWCKNYLGSYMADHVEGKGLRQPVWPLDEGQGPSHLHGHNPWLVCEVALMLKATLHCGQGPWAWKAW